MLVTGAVGYAGAHAQQQAQTGNQTDAGNGSQTPAECLTETATTTEAANESATDTASSTATDSTGLEVVSTDSSPERGIWVEVANTGEDTWHSLEVGAAFYDAQDAVVTDGSSTLFGLFPGETWRTFITHGEPETVESSDVEITSTSGDTPLTTADELGLTVENARMVDAGPTILADVTNTTGNPLSYLEVIGRFRDDEYIYDGEWTNETDLAEGDTWRVEMEYFTVAPEDPPITDYDLHFAT